MTGSTGRAVKKGIGFGLIAGVVFGLMEVIGAGAMGNPALAPLRMFASIVLGQAALETVSIGTAVVIGVIVHLALSAVFGMVYALINSRLSTEARTKWGSQAGIGLLFGVGLWLVNFQIIARALYPWFLMTPQFLQAVMHALFFGLPLGLMYAAAERRARPMRRAPLPA